MNAKAFTIAGVMTFLLLAVSIFIGTAYANPSFFLFGEATATATTTVTYMSPGTATTSIVQRAMTNGNTNALNSATLLVQLTGSSTNSAVNVTFEYADLVGTNCYTSPTACDWYRDALIGDNAVVGTTTNGTLGVVPNSYNIQFASSTIGGIVNNTRATRILTVPVPAPFVRAVITMPIGSTNGAIWAQFLPIKEKNE